MRRSCRPTSPPSPMANPSPSAPSTSSRCVSRRLDLHLDRPRGRSARRRRCLSEPATLASLGESRTGTSSCSSVSNATTSIACVPGDSRSTVEVAPAATTSTSSPTRLAGRLRPSTLDSGARARHAFGPLFGHRDRGVATRRRRQRMTSSSPATAYSPGRASGRQSSASLWPERWGAPRVRSRVGPRSPRGGRDARGSARSG